MRPAHHRCEAAVLPIGRVIQRRLIAACFVAALGLAPLTAQAAGSADVDALWNQPQAAAERDLAGSSDLSALWGDNANRDSAFLVKINAVTIASDGLAGSLNDAGQSTVAIAAKEHGDDKAKGKDKTGKNHNDHPQGNGKP